MTIDPGERTTPTALMAVRWGQYAYPGVKHYGRNETMADETTTAGAPRIRFATHDGLRVRGGDWDHYLFHWEVISATGRTYRGDYKQGTGIGWQLDADTARATILRELGESGALRTDDDIAEWLRDMGADDPGEIIRLLRAAEGMRRFYDRCTAGERAALDAYAAGDWED